MTINKQTKTEKRTRRITVTLLKPEKMETTGTIISASNMHSQVNLHFHKAERKEVLCKSVLSATICFTEMFRAYSNYVFQQTLARYKTH